MTPSERFSNRRVKPTAGCPNVKTNRHTKLKLISTKSVRVFRPCTRLHLIPQLIKRREALSHRSDSRLDEHFVLLSPPPIEGTHRPRRGGLLKHSVPVGWMTHCSVPSPHGRVGNHPDSPLLLLAHFLPSFPRQGSQEPSHPPSLVFVWQNTGRFDSLKASPRQFSLQILLPSYLSR